MLVSHPLPACFFGGCILAIIAIIGIIMYEQIIRCLLPTVIAVDVDSLLTIRQAGDFCRRLLWDYVMVLPRCYSVSCQIVISFCDDE